MQTAGVEAVDGSKAAQTLFRVRVPYFAGALFALLGFLSWIRGLMSVAAHLNSCFITASLGFLVLLTITGVILFFEYRPDLAAKRVAEQKAAENGALDSIEMRTFTSADGRTMEAALLRFDGKKVKIKRADGRIFTNSIELYSAEDRDFVTKNKGIKTTSRLAAFIGILVLVSSCATRPPTVNSDSDTNCTLHTVPLSSETDSPARTAPQAA